MEVETKANIHGGDPLLAGAAGRWVTAQACVCRLGRWPKYGLAAQFQWQRCDTRRAIQIDVLPYLILPWKLFLTM